MKTGTKSRGYVFNATVKQLPDISAAVSIEPNNVSMTKNILKSIQIEDENNRWKKRKNE